MNSVARHNYFAFDQAPSVSIPRSVFDRSHGHKSTFNSEWLVPIYVDEVLPGDTFNLKATIFARLATPLFPTMDNCYLETFFFFVPNRLIWSHWEQFMGQQANPTDSIAYTVPVVNRTGSSGTPASLQDFFGIPIGNDGGGTAISHCTYNNLHGRAYNLIWNEWFRDENLQNSVTVDTGDGPDTEGNYVLLNRGKRHDYFCASLPWPQKWNAVNVLLSNQAILTSNDAGTHGRQRIVGTWEQTSGTQFGMQGATSTTLNADAAPAANATYANWPLSTDAVYDYANLAAVNPTIDQLHQSVQLQRFYQKDARGGTRYTELMRSHFGVVSPDARLQRPEFLGGGRSPVNLHPIAQTSATGVAGTTTHLGDLSAFGVSSGSSHGFSKSFVEHGVLIGLANIRADQTYQQGLNKMWSRQVRTDYYFPSFAHIGEQAVLNQEIYYVDNVTGAAQNAAVFGYQERHADYRYKPSYTSGEFRSNYSTPLDSWHYAYQFTALPVLNSTFIQATDFIGRTLAVPTQPFFLVDMWFDLKCARPMPVRSVPGILGRL